MSASNEWFEFHLTPGGWVGGSEKLDFVGTKDKEVPQDRVLTLTFYEKLSSPFSRTELYYTEDWRHSDSNLVNTLVEKHGAKPPNYDDLYTLR